MIRAGWTAVVCCVLALSLHGQSSDSRSPRYTPRRMARGEVIRVDGNLDEPVWARVGALGELTQVEPVEGAPAGERTVVRIAYDAEFVYLAIRCHEEPRRVRANQLRRDEPIRFDDVVDFWFDTFQDRRFAYWFQISAGGARGDGLLSGGGETFNKNWDGIWYGEAAVDEHGWRAEVALPFKTLAFRESASEWGFNLRRKRVADGERLRWSSPHAGQSFFRLAGGGVLDGLAGMRQGLGLDIAPYVKLEANEALDGERRDRDWLGDSGFDLTWRPTPQSSLSLTTNTDFAETEVDERRVNLTRFPLFFPEKRDFFLEDAGLFEFGSPDRRRDLVPFFSRRVGRDEEGQPVTILGGLKWSGRFEDWNIGALEVFQDAHRESDGDELDSLAIGTLRVSRNVGAESTLGMIATDGDPLSGRSARTFGLDAHLSSSDMLGDGHSGDLWGYWLNSQSEGAGGEGHAFGLRGLTRGPHWRHDLSAHVVGSEFEPALGFVRRTEVRRYRYEATYTWRATTDGGIREADWRIAPTYVTDLHGTTDNWAVPVRLCGIEFESEDRLELETHRIHERIPEEGFELADCAPVEGGEYTTTRYFFEFEASPRRAFGGDVGLEYGDFYSGRLRRVEVDPRWLPSPNLSLGLGFEWIDVELETGAFDARVASATVDLDLSAEKSWLNLVQYDTSSEQVGVQSRFHWILEPGRDLFLVGSLGWDRDSGALVPNGHALALKLKTTLRF